MNTQKKDTSNEKGVDDMATIAKTGHAYVVNQNKTSEFIQFLNAHKKPDNYWEECYKVKSAFSREHIEKMKKMCNGDTDE